MSENNKCAWVAVQRVNPLEEIEVSQDSSSGLKAQVEPISGVSFKVISPTHADLKVLAQPTSDNFNVQQGTPANLQATVTPAGATTWAVTQSGTWTVVQGGAGATPWPVDVSDEPLRDLGKVDIAAFDAAVDVSDRAARLVGKVDPRPGNSYDQTGQHADLATNPASGTAIASSGDLPAGLYELSFFVGGTAASNKLRVVVRNAANAPVTVWISSFVADGSFGALVWYLLGANFDIIVEAAATLTGTFHGSLTWRRLVTT